MTSSQTKNILNHFNTPYFSLGVSGLNDQIKELYELKIYKMHNNFGQYNYGVNNILLSNYIRKYGDQLNIIDITFTVDWVVQYDSWYFNYCEFGVDFDKYKKNNFERLKDVIEFTTQYKLKYEHLKIKQISDIMALLYPYHEILSSNYFKSYIMKNYSNDDLIEDIINKLESDIEELEKELEEINNELKTVKSNSIKLDLELQLINIKDIIKNKELIEIGLSDLLIVDEKYNVEDYLLALNYLPND